MASRRAAVAAIACLVSLATPAPARADWLLAAFLGAAATQASTVTVNQPARGTNVTLGGVEYQGESFRSPQYYAVRVSWTGNQTTTLALEGEFIHAKVYAKTDRPVRMQGTVSRATVDATRPLSSLVQRLSMSHGLNFILANVALRHGIGRADASGRRRVTAVVRAGAGPTMPHAESEIDHVFREQYEQGGLGVQAGGGVEIRLWQRLAAAGDYKFTWASPEIDVSDGHAHIPSHTHHLTFGLAYRF